jgi:diguanylate cyclase (GGDEF)-like protein
MKGCCGRLRALVPGSIAARGLILIALVAGSVAVPAVLVCRAQAQREFRQQQYASETFLAVALMAYLENGTSVGPERDAWLQRVAALGRRVTWAGVYDAEGDGLEFRRRTTLAQEKIAAQIDLGARQPGRTPLLLDGVKSQRFELLTVPQPGDVTLAVIIDRGYDAEPSGLGLFWPVCLGLAGLVAALVWFHYGIEEPILRIGQKLAAVHAGLSEAALSDAAPTELAKLVTSVAQTRQELEKWRGEATHLRHTVNVVVDARTRQAESARHRAEREADTDPLTRLGNRRLLERELPTLFAERQMAGGELALVVLDVDHLKVLNDTCGHEAGDQILAFTGDLLRATLRKGLDRAVRSGGDEFVLVLPDTPALEACEVARRLTSLFAQRAKMFRAVNPLPSLSAGVASLRQHAAGSWEELLRMADEAMYWAKRRRHGVATVADARRTP